MLASNAIDDDEKKKEYRDEDEINVGGDEPNLDDENYQYNIIKLE